ncbi:MAG: tetratricopeptide repeat protein, partial [bacterium]
MKKICIYIIFLSLFILISYTVLADEYVVTMSENEELTANMLEKYNEDLKEYGEIKYSNHKEFNEIKWDRDGEKRITKLDIDNDGQVETIKKYNKYINGYLTEVIDVYNGDKKAATIGKFEDNKYKLTSMTKRINGDHYYMAGRFEIRPFIYKDKIYLAVESKYGNREIFVTFEVTENYKLKEIGYYIKIYSSKVPENIWDKYNEALQVFKDTEDPERAVEILEKNKVKKMIRNKGEDISKGKYIRILNDYAYFLKLAGREAEALAILRDVIYLNPERAVAYYNLGNIYMELGDKKRGKYCYWKYTNLLKKGANVLEKVKQALQGYEPEKEMDLSNLSKPDYSLRYLLIMSKKYDLCQEVGEVINENVQREIEEYGKPKFEFHDQYTGNGFDGFDWESMAYGIYGRVYISSFDIDNDGEMELVEKTGNYLADIMSNILKFYDIKDKNKYIQVMSKIEDEGIQVYRDNLVPKLEESLHIRNFEAKELPVYKIIHNIKVYYKFEYPFNIWPYKFKDNYYIVIREGMPGSLGFLGLFSSKGDAGKHFGYYLLSKDR